MTSIVIIEDEKILSDLLTGFFSNHDDYDVLDTFTDGLVALKNIKELKPDLILSDICIPSLNGIEILKRLRANRMNAKFMLLSNDYTKNNIQHALQSGVDGMIEKSASIEEMISAIKTVMAGDCFYGKDVLSLMRESMMNPRANNPLDLITDREREVVQLIAEGYNTKEISDKLEIGVKTYETHKLRLMQKLGFRGVADITRFAIEYSLISYNKEE
jgi:DNA-binding NarL/FixJ family response regulator